MGAGWHARTHARCALPTRPAQVARTQIARSSAVLAVWRQPPAARAGWLVSGTVRYPANRATVPSVLRAMAAAGWRHRPFLSTSGPRQTAARGPRPLRRGRASSRSSRGGCRTPRAPPADPSSGRYCQKVWIGVLGWLPPVLPVAGRRAAPCLNASGSGLPPVRRQESGRFAQLFASGPVRIHPLPGQGRRAVDEPSQVGGATQVVVGSRIAQWRSPTTSATSSPSYCNSKLIHGAVSQLGFAGTNAPM